MLTVLQNGWIAAQIDAAYAPRASDIARRKAGITGVSEFPDVREAPVLRAPPDPEQLQATAAWRIAATRISRSGLSELSTARDRTAVAVAAATASATIGQMGQGLGFGTTAVVSVAAIEPRSFAEPFEQLRDASDAWSQTHGRRPAVFLANMGKVAHHTARANYAKNFFEAGGFDVISNDGFAEADAAVQAFLASQAKIAVICSSDKLYPDVVPPLAAKLKSAGARCVVLAGNPGENEQTWRTAGVNRFIFVKCDVIQILRELLREEGVLGL
jgi:methylmalonyl-CoA mutase